MKQESHSEGLAEIANWADETRKQLLGAALLELAARDEAAHAIMTKAIALITDPADTLAFHAWSPPPCPRSRD